LIIFKRYIIINHVKGQRHALPGECGDRRDYLELTYTVGKEEAGLELKIVLRSKLRLSASMIRRLKRGNGIFVNDLPVYTNYRVLEGDNIRISYAEASPDIPAQKGELDIVYEDEWFIVLKKPRGVITHPSRSRYTGTILNFALYYVQQQGGVTVHAVNRLDRDTSGLVLLAKSAYAKNLCTGVPIEKTYLALVWGEPGEDRGTIDLPIKREKKMNMRRIVSSEGDRAVTKYEVVAKCGEYSLLRLKLETGRTHQIRVHCSTMGHPVLGDRLYGTEQSLELSDRLGVEAHMLHACRLSFCHPVTGGLLDIDCPPDWIELGQGKWHR
jgi:RluA family pseudouridine synthase